MKNHECDDHPIPIKRRDAENAEKRGGDFGLRWQSAAATPLFGCGRQFQSGVALRFPPQSKNIWLWPGRVKFSASLR